MSIIEALILGVVQGLTEFIPVSSSGHLILMHQALGVTENGLAFDVSLHAGTLLALLIYFHKDIWQLLRSLVVKSSQTKLAYMLMAATIPAAIIGFLLENSAESAFRSVRLVVINLSIVAIILLLAEWYATRVKQKTSLDKVSTKQALAMGVAQAVAIVPGVSRSGITISTGLFAGLDRVAATRFSFLLGIPITAGAIAKVFTDSSSLQTISSQKSIFAVGITTAFVSGLVAIVFMLRYLSKHTLKIFAYYRLALALIVTLISVL